MSADPETRVAVVTGAGKAFAAGGDLAMVERIGMVSMAVPTDEVLDRALEVAAKVAAKVATGSQLAIRWTKRALNNWVRAAGPIFDQSAAYEMLCFSSPGGVPTKA